MVSTLSFKINIVVAVICLNAALANAQDSARKVVSKPASSAAALKPVTSGIPINPKTGKPYGKWGYGNKTSQVTNKDTSSNLTAPAATPVVTDKSLSGQYKYLLTKVYNHQQPFIAAFWKNVRDTINNGRQQLKAANEKLAASNQSINTLQTSVKERETQLSKAESVDFFGISFSKNGYSTMMWSLVLILGALAGIVIFRSGSARSEATYRTKLYADLEEEFKTYKAKANEKEKKLARELQTERNKVDELMGRG